MLTFRNTMIAFLLLLGGLIALDVYSNIGWYYYALLIFLLSLVLFYGSAYVASSFYMPVITKAETSQKQIAISFDDGPAGNYTEPILDILLERAVPAGFFCIGKNIAGNELTLQRIVRENHLIGNHSYCHDFWFDMYSAAKMNNDLAMMNSITQDVTGLRPRLFRPPYGVTNPNLARAVKKQDLVAIGWNIRSMDTVIKNPQRLLDKVLKAVKPGAIVLFHDTSEATFRMLPAFIQNVREQGYEIVRLDKLLNIAPYA